MNILFLCVANSARSQLAEGLARHMFGKVAHVESAGSVPSGKVNPFAVEAMDEIDLDISGHYSKAIDELDKDFVKHLDYVITLCAEEVCPIFLTHAKKLHWPNPDPAAAEGGHEDKLHAFRTTRKNIKISLEALCNELCLDKTACDLKKTG